MHDLSPFDVGSKRTRAELGTPPALAVEARAMAGFSLTTTRGHRSYLIQTEGKLFNTFSRARPVHYMSV